MNTKQNTEATTLTINTDGGSRGNPGPAAIGIVVRQGSEILFTHGEKIGVTTNNVAEYTAVLKAAELLKEKGLNMLPQHFVLDSLLVVEQMKGNYQVKNEGLRQLKKRILELLDMSRVTFSAVPRNLNREADALVNQALDS